MAQTELVKSSTKHSLSYFRVNFIYFLMRWNLVKLRNVEMPLLIPGELFFFFCKSRSSPSFSFSVLLPTSSKEQCPPLSSSSTLAMALSSGWAQPYLQKNREKAIFSSLLLTTVNERLISSLSTEACIEKQSICEHKFTKQRLFS